MRRLIGIVGIGLLSVAAVPALAQNALPLVEEVEFTAFRSNGLRLAAALEQLPDDVPAAVVKKLQSLLRDGGQEHEAVVKEIQQLLDPYCLIGVGINPESRVKAARGPAKAELKRGRDVYALIKVANEAGVTHALLLSGPQLRSTKAAGDEQWLSAAIQTMPPFAKTLSGQKLDYVVVRLRTDAAGKREATLKFDVGQGTQDLGFRAEVPILFTIKAKE